MKTFDPLANSLGIFAETYRYLQKSKKTEQNIQQLKIEWADAILRRLNVDLEVIGEPSQSSSILFIGNHISYLDVPLVMSKLKDISFVAKNELNAWPIFGEAARKIDTVFVQREQRSSRNSARKAISMALNSGKRIVIFPSGTTCTNEAKPWRKGVFDIAKHADIFVQPFRISYSPLRPVAYIDQDFFPAHLYNLCRHEKIKARIEFHAPVKILDPSFDCIQWQYWSKGLL